MDTLLTRALKYQTFQGKMFGASADALGFHNSIYGFWKEFWTDVFRGNASSDLPKPDDFLRQDHIGIFMHQNRPVALHSHTFYDLRQRSAVEGSFLSHCFSDRFFNQLIERGVHQVMTVESFVVVPRFRAPNLGVSIAAVMLGLGLKLAEAAGVDASIAAARSDIGVDRLAGDQGAVALETGVPIHNTPCSLMAFFRNQVHSHVDKNVNLLIEYFWKNRIQVGGQTTEKVEEIAA